MPLTWMLKAFNTCKRHDIEIAGNANAGRAGVDRAVRRGQHDVAQRRILAGNAEQRADAGAGDEAGRTDAAIAVDVADELQRRIGGGTLRALAGIEIAIGREHSMLPPCSVKTRL